MWSKKYQGRICVKWPRKASKWKDLSWTFEHWQALGSGEVGENKERIVWAKIWLCSEDRAESDLICVGEQCEMRLER